MSIRFQRRAHTSRRRFSLPALARAAGLATALVLSATSVAAARDELDEAEMCSDSTPDRRPCTATEEVGYCLANAEQSFWECREAADGLLDLAVCSIAFDYAALACLDPIRAFLKQ